MSSQAEYSDSMKQHTGILGGIWEEAGMILVLVGLFTLCSIVVPNFLSFRNMDSLALAVSQTGMVACTMLFCLASGDFDMSVGSIVACSGVVCAVIMEYTGSIFLGISGGLLLGLIVGIANGVIIAILGINALITTLATMQIVRGAGYIFSNGRAVGIYFDDFFVLGNNDFIGIPIPVWICIVCFVVFGTLLAKTTFGRNTLAIGGNEEAAYLAGINVKLTKIIIFSLQGVIAGFAGIVLASRMTSGQPMTSQGFELEVISACVLGGVAMTGGVGRISFVIAGVLIMGIIQNSMNLMNVDSFYQYLARGVILLAAVIFDKIKNKNNAS